ncbi:ferredoxin [Eubacterium barkeri]|uniref:Ferredoxin n=1 Tax=Eubacterium barkeri TaxID=1528 RepID=A0A1H3BMI8_EUBBA|nr:ferredoxin [Eubacterium barkeri]SDX43192.1 ferredoxin [Eubacterium barkeri]
MRVTINDECIGCGLCVAECPEVFDMGDEGVACVLTDDIAPDLEEKVCEAVEGCPVAAIEIEED